MFDIGLSELLLIGVVALLVLGPEKLPGFARTLGGLLAKLRTHWQSMHDTLEQEILPQSLRQSMSDIKKNMHTQLTEIQSEVISYPASKTAEDSTHDNLKPPALHTPDSKTNEPN